MKIKEVNTNYILFDNGSRITFDHEQDCCETNYADFEQLEDLALEYEFENDLIFEVVPENGFRFGSKGTPMFFIPCYSDQNGYYSSDIDIFYDGRHGEDEMGIKNDCRRNAEGYSDPTAYEALKNMEQEDERFHKLLDTIFALCELSDFHIEERIVIKDKRTGRIWR